MSGKRIDLLHALRGTLRFHLAMGIEEYPYTENVRRFLEKNCQPGAGSAPAGEKIHPAQSPSARFENLVQEITACTLCHLSHNSPGRVPGMGGHGCRLMVVGDCSSQGQPFSPELLFGKGEDVMLWKMMAAIDLQPGQVYVTNCIKCCPANAGDIDEACEKSCFSFLAREIAALTPPVICAMGDMAVRALLGKKEPVARARGRFGRYLYPSGQDIKVMPTFHPRFLLRHPEMKKATWQDLLAIKRCFARR